MVHKDQLILANSHRNDLEAFVGEELPQNSKRLWWLRAGAGTPNDAEGCHPPRLAEIHAQRMGSVQDSEPRGARGVSNLAAQAGKEPSGLGSLCQGVALERLHHQLKWQHLHDLWLQSRPDGSARRC